MTIVFFTISVGSIVVGELANWATVVHRDALNLSRWYLLSVFIVTLIPGYVMYKIRKLDSRSAQLAKQGLSSVLSSWNFTVGILDH